MRIASFLTEWRAVAVCLLVLAVGTTNAGTQPSSNGQPQVRIVYQFLQVDPDCLPDSSNRLLAATNASDTPTVILTSEQSLRLVKSASNPMAGWVGEPQRLLCDSHTQYKFSIGGGTFYSYAINPGPSTQPAGNTATTQEVLDGYDLNICPAVARDRSNISLEIRYSRVSFLAFFEWEKRMIGPNGDVPVVQPSAPETPTTQETQHAANITVPVGKVVVLGLKPGWWEKADSQVFKNLLMITPTIVH
jgi:hypothetical protein